MHYWWQIRSDNYPCLQYLLALISDFVIGFIRVCKNRSRWNFFELKFPWNQTWVTQLKISFKWLSNQLSWLKFTRTFKVATCRFRGTLRQKQTLIFISSAENHWRKKIHYPARVLIKQIVEVQCRKESTGIWKFWFYSGTYLLTAGNDRGVTPHSIDQSNQFRSRALRSIEHERVHDFYSKQFSWRQPSN